MGRAFQNRKESMAKTAAAKTKVYSKYGREIYVCAKAGGTDPNGNLALRGLMERAKKDQVPSHVIDKALDKASGAGGEDFSPARYEGFGPGNAMVISHDRWFLDRIATHILAFEDSGEIVFLEGNYREYEDDFRRRTGAEPGVNRRHRHKKLA
mgnify:FL=1